MRIGICKQHLPWVFAVILDVLLVAPAFAVEAGQVAYTSGTLAVPQGTVGSLDATSPTTLIFKSGVPGSAANEIDIDYKNIKSFHYETEVARHVGVLPAIAVGLVRSRERKHYFFINYADASNVAQVVVFEVSKHDPPSLLAILNARVAGCRATSPRCGAPGRDCNVSVEMVPCKRGGAAR